MINFDEFKELCNSCKKCKGKDMVLVCKCDFEKFMEKIKKRP